MTDRLTSTMLVGALIRSAQAQGGNAMVLAKGDATSGAILIQTIDRGLVDPVVPDPHLAVAKSSRHRV